MPPLIGALAGERVRAVGVLDRALLVVLEAAVLVPASVWETTEQRA
jgi:hypothetical protein